MFPQSVCILYYISELIWIIKIDKINVEIDVRLV